MIELTQLMMKMQEYNDALLNLKSTSKTVMEHGLLDDVKIAYKLYATFGMLHQQKNELTKAISFHSKMPEMCASLLNNS